MKKLPTQGRSRAFSVACALFASVSLAAQGDPTLVAYWDFNDTGNPETTLDRLFGFEGLIQGDAAFTAGRTGGVGDNAIDFGLDSAGQVIRVDDVPFLNLAAADDQITISFWQSLHAIASSSAFWGVSPSSSDGQRGIQAHVPWGDGNIYFDTAGCCGADLQRISANVVNFEPNFSSGWHHLAFVKDGAAKQIWVNGQLFHEGVNTLPLPLDFTRLMIGANPDGGISMQGIMDDFAVFAGALSPASIGQLATGTPPDQLPGVNVLTEPLVSAAIGSHIGFSVDIIDSAAMPVDPDSFEVRFNGSPITVSVTKVGNTTTVAYSDPSTLLPPASAHEVALDFKDTTGNDYNAVRTFVVINYAIIPPEYALAPGSATTPGIRFRTVEAIELWDTTTVLPTTIARAEAQLAGTLINPNTGQPYINGAEPGPNPDESFTVPVVNFEERGEDAGQMGGDAPFPGLDMPPDDYNNFSTEALAYLELSAGYYRLGVNSDDGFQLRVGRPARSVIDSLVLGAVDAGRGAADTLIDFVAPVDGIYPFRLIHFEGGGGASLEWWSMDLETGERLLINDTTNPNAVRSFAFAAQVDALAYVRSTTPGPGAEFVQLADPIQAVIVAGTAPLPGGSIRMELNGTSVTPAVSTQDGVTTVTYTPVPDLDVGSTYTVTLSFGTGAQEVANEWQFSTVTFYPNTLVAYWPFNDASDPGISLDSTAQIPGSIENGAVFTPDAGGFSGQPGDRAIDLGMSSEEQLVQVADAGFFALASQRDQVTISFWQSLHAVADTFAFWGSSSSSGGGRGISAHTPWSNNNIYFDTVGCCDPATQRIDANVLQFMPEFAVGWRHLAFVKNGPTKQIWVDGQLFLEGVNTLPLPDDIASLTIGAAQGGFESLQGIIDDFAVFANALGAADIALLAAGSSPMDIADVVGPGVGAFSAIALDNGELVMEWQGPGTLEFAPDLGGSWTADPGATSPYRTTPTGDMRYYRLRQ